MSDISADSSFELISDSDHSDVDESSIMSVQLDNHTRNKDESSVVESKFLEQKVPEVNKSSGHSDSSFKQVIASDQSDIDKSPFESDRSANDLQNTDHSDVIEQKVVEAEAIGLPTEKTASIRRREHQSDINQATDHSGDGNLLNTSQSDAVEPNIVDAETPTVLEKQKPTSPKKSFWNRRRSNHSDINQSSEHSDDNNLLSEETRKLIQAEAVQAYIRLSEETRRKHHQQKLAADSVSFCVLLIMCLFVIGVGAVLSGPLIARNNANPIVKKLNVTMVNQEKVYLFPKETKQKIMDDVQKKKDIDRFKKISEMQKIIQEITFFSQVPVYLRNKFIPDYSRFEGVEEFLQNTQTNGTVVEEYLYLCSPRIEVEDENLYVYFVNMDTFKSVENFRIEDCEKFDDCHDVYWSMKNGNLHIREKFTLNSQEYEFTRVFFIPPHEII